MSFGGCKRDLLNPTRWLAITYGIAAAVNLREELTTLLVMKAMVASSLHTVTRLFQAQSSLRSLPRLFRERLFREIVAGAVHCAAKVLHASIEPLSSPLLNQDMRCCDVP